MDRVFNMGVGMIAIVDPGSVSVVVDAAEARGVTAWELGSVEPGTGVTYA